MLTAQRLSIRLQTSLLYRPLTSGRTPLAQARHVIALHSARRPSRRLYSSEPQKSSQESPRPGGERPPLHRTLRVFSSRNLTNARRLERLAAAWTDTPTKWYPLPVAVGALLLIVLQYRRTRRSEKEVQLDEHGHEVVRLKGPWQVSLAPRTSFRSSTSLHCRLLWRLSELKPYRPLLLTARRFTSSARCRSTPSLVSGGTSIH